jgi:hypothetical protein
MRDKLSTLKIWLFKQLVVLLQTYTKFVQVCKFVNINSMSMIKLKI